MLWKRQEIYKPLVGERLTKPCRTVFDLSNMHVTVFVPQHKCERLNLPNVKWFDQLFSKRFSHLEQSISRSSNAKKLERDATTSHEPWVMSHESWHRQRSGCLLDYSLTYRFINDSRRDSYAEMKWMAQAIDLTNPTKPHITLFIYLF